MNHTSTPRAKPPLTARARKVIDLACAEAKRSGAESPACSHVLVGLLLEGGGAAAKVLVNLGMDLRSARKLMLEQISGKAEPSMDVVLSEAGECACALGHPQVGTEHLLLAALKASGSGSLVVRAGLKPDEVRDLVLEVMGAEIAFREPAPKRRAGRIPTWVGLLLIVLAVVLAGAIGLLLERLTATRLPH